MQAKQKGTPSWSFDELKKALYYADDMFERSSMKYFLIDETLKEAQQETLTSPLTFGIRKTDLTKFAKNTLRALVPGVEFVEEKGEVKFVRFEHEGVPISLKLFTSNNSLFKNLDRIFAFHEQFNVPNPANKYIQMRGVLK